MIGTVLYIADDHPIVTQSLVEEFKNDFTSIEVFVNGNELIQACKNLIPSHVILDINMPGISGIDFLQHAQKSNFEMHIVVFSMYNSPALVRKCRRLGAHSFVLKTALNSEVRIGLKTNTFYLGTDMEPIESAEEIVISQREKEILQLLAEDYGTKQIADKLFISEFTVSTHRRNLKKKLKADTTAGMIQKAYEEGIILV